MRLGPPEPTQPTLAPLQPAVNPRADTPPIQAFLAESPPPDTPLPHHDLPDRRSLTRSRPKPLLLTNRAARIAARNRQAEHAPAPAPAHRTTTPSPEAPAQSSPDPGSRPIAALFLRSADTSARPRRTPAAVTPPTRSSEGHPDAACQADAAHAAAAHVVQRTPRQLPRRARPQYPCSHRRPLPLRQLPQPAARSVCRSTSE